MAAQQGPTSGIAPVRQIMVAGVNLFRIALEELGDATQWNRIAALSGLPDPWLSGVVTLNIPPLDPNAGGGILNNPAA